MSAARDDRSLGGCDVKVSFSAELVDSVGDNLEASVFKIGYRGPCLALGGL